MTNHQQQTRRRRFCGMASVGGAVAFLTAWLLVALAGSAQAAATSVLLGQAESFVVLAGAGITNTGPTTLNGDIGTFPTTSITGAYSITITGKNHGGDAVTQGAKKDLVTAYNVAAGQKPRSPITADLAGQTLVSGVYNSASSIGLTGALTLDAEGDPDAVFVFQAGSTLKTASSSRVNLINGAQACNVFWQVGSSATLGTATAFRGTIIALTDITLTTGATVEGRVLARNGAVTLDTNTITRPACTPVTPPTTTAPTSTGPTTTTSPTTGTGQSTTTPPGGTGQPGGTGGSPGSGTPDQATPTATGTNRSGVPLIDTAGKGRPPTQQITNTPGGGIGTGDSRGGSDLAAHPRLTQALALVGAGAILAVAVSRRRREN